MALSLKDKETDRLAREVAALTGETLTDAIRKALAERLERERLRRGGSTRLADRLMEIGRHCETGRTDLELLLRDGGFDIVSVTLQQAEIAIDAFRRFGRGRH